MPTVFVSDLRPLGSGFYPLLFWLALFKATSGLHILVGAEEDSSGRRSLTEPHTPGFLLIWPHFFLFRITRSTASPQLWAQMCAVNLTPPPLTPGLIRLVLQAPQSCHALHLLSSFLSIISKWHPHQPATTELLPPSPPHTSRPSILPYPAPRFSSSAFAFLYLCHHSLFQPSWISLGPR